MNNEHNQGNLYRVKAQYNRKDLAKHIMQYTISSIVKLDSSYFEVHVVAMG